MSNPISHFTRRTFIKTTAAAGLAATVGHGLMGAEEEKKDGIPQVMLGATGAKVSRIGLGGFHIGVPLLDADGIKIIRTALDSGINFLDNCWDYHRGGSEVRMGKALRDGYRDRAFLMTKIDGRTKAACAAQIDESLQRLQTDHVDLMQFHEIIRMEDPDRVFAAGGALEAMMDAKKAGKVRYVGFTGHKSPEIHLKMLAVADAHGFHFDTVQMPINVMDAHYDSFAEKVIPELEKRKIGVLGMKPFGGGVLLKSKTVEPLECLHYALNTSPHVVITGCQSMDLLNQAMQAVKTYMPMTKEQVAAILAKTAPVAGSGQYELYKTTINFDGTTHNPKDLG